MIYIKDFATNFVSLFIDMAPYLMLGLLFVGLMDAFVRKETILKHLGKDDFSSVLKASVVGVPLPLCSCGVVPTALGLKKNGASNGAVVSFLTSTPQTGVDSILATYSLMGGFMAIVRPITAFISGIICGLFVDIFAKNDNVKDKIHQDCCCGEKHEETNHHEKQHETCSCGHHHEEEHETCNCGHHHEQHDTCSCCSENASNKDDKKGFSQILPAMKKAYGGFLDELSWKLFVGIIIATLISTFIPADFFVSLGLEDGILSMLAMVAIGLPMYICSVASIPIAISLIAKGLSLGSAFVFLFVGPVTNIASIMMIYKALGKKITTIYISTSIIIAIAVGIFIDFAVENFNLQVLLQAGSVTHGSGGVLAIVVSIIFALLMIRGIVKHFTNKKLCA